MADYKLRREGILRYLEERKLDGALMTSYENRRYFCGFSGIIGTGKGNIASFTVFKIRNASVLSVAEIAVMILPRHFA